MDRLQGRLWNECEGPYACVDCERDEKAGRFRIRTHAQFERYKQAQGSAMIFAVPIQWLRLSFVQTCVAGYLKARAASREEIGTRTTRLTCSRRACFSPCTAVSPLKQSISLFEGRRRLYTSKAYLRARTKPPARYTGSLVQTSHKSLNYSDRK